MTSPSKRISHAGLRPRFRDGMSLFFGGFMGVGTPDGIVREISTGRQGPTIIGNDTAGVDTGIGILATQRKSKGHRLARGTNPRPGGR
jgi:acetate CoA/acetoacetate CoA-transferase alpha subunit